MFALIIVVSDHPCCVFIVFHSLCFCLLFFSLSIQLRTCCLSDMEEKVKEFAAKLTLVPIPPPGQLHVVCVQCVFMYPKDFDRLFLVYVFNTVWCIYFHCVLLLWLSQTSTALTMCLSDVYTTSSNHCSTIPRRQRPPTYRFRPPSAFSLLQATTSPAGITHTCCMRQLTRVSSLPLIIHVSVALQVISCLLQEQRVVLLSANWARLTLVAECLMHFIQVWLKFVFIIYDWTLFILYTITTF